MNLKSSEMWFPQVTLNSRIGILQSEEIENFKRSEMNKFTVMFSKSTPAVVHIKLVRSEATWSSRYKTKRT